MICCTAKKIVLRSAALIFCKSMAFELSFLLLHHFIFWGILVTTMLIVCTAIISIFCYDLLLEYKDIVLLINCWIEYNFNVVVVVSHTCPICLSYPLPHLLCNLQWMPLLLSLSLLLAGGAPWKINLMETNNHLVN